MEPVIEFLKKQPLFSSVRKNMGIDLGAKLVFQYAIKSQYILRQGERDTNNLYMIYKGTAHAEYYSAQTGSVMTSDKVEPGHVLGTHAVVHYRHNITSVVAQSDCKLIAIPRKLLVELDLLRVLEQSELTSADGKQRASTDFEKLLENVFRVFDKDAQNSWLQLLTAGRRACLLPFSVLCGK
jgi:signal-transduction protein with cAMP-binding, CBS, and nucleotidyltransferase domain